MSDTHQPKFYLHFLETPHPEAIKPKVEFEISKHWLDTGLPLVLVFLTFLFLHLRPHRFNQIFFVIPKKFSIAGFVGGSDALFLEKTTGTGILLVDWAGSTVSGFAASGLHPLMSGT